MSQPLPQLSTSAKQISQQLTAQIFEHIAQSDGVISFAQFMQLALYTPQLGYYQNPLYTFGEKGDFITAPEMGNLFATCIAKSLSATLVESTERKLNILELGAGSGKLACDLILQLQKLDVAIDKYQILEPSASLQNQQRQLLEEAGVIDSVEWLAGLPEHFSGHIIANEVVDAIPCERIQKVGQSWRYLGVAVDAEQLTWQVMGDVDETDLPSALVKSEHYVEGYQTEIRPMVSAWIKSLASTLQNGSITLFDYGYPQAELYHPQRHQGSLQCFSRHSQHSDPFNLVGLQDITAHVDFTQLASAAASQTLEVSGFSTQSGYLLDNGILDFGQLNSAVETYQQSRQIQKLTAPGQMGEVVKVMLLSKGNLILPSGFQLQDHLYRL